MKEEKIRRSEKTREFQSRHMDSEIWNRFKFRDDDVIIASYAKSGTTWIQQIVAQLIFNGEEGINVADLSPWIELRMPPGTEVLEKMEAQNHRRFMKTHLPADALVFSPAANLSPWIESRIPSGAKVLEKMEAQNHRRFMKTHLPADALVFSPAAKYIFIGRDGRDVVWSYYNHQANVKEVLYEWLNNVPELKDYPPLEPPPKSIKQYFLTWLAKDGHPFWPFWDHIRSWWVIRDLPNLLMLHFNAMKIDMPGQIRRIAGFLDIPIDASKWETILEHCSFEYMKKHAEKVVPGGGIIFKGGAQTFIHKGVNGRWRDILSAEESRQYEDMAEENLGKACAHWLKTGEFWVTGGKIGL